MTVFCKIVPDKLRCSSLPICTLLTAPTGKPVGFSPQIYNGHEFADISGIERSICGGRRTTVFFCEPNRSDEKGSCENNHKYIRYVIPKGTSLDPYMQSDISLMMDHVNSFKRKSLNGKCPYEIGRLFLPEDFFLCLGLEQIPPDEVNLTPSLLR